MNIKDYIDSTYLKTPSQSGLTEEETRKKVQELCDEAAENNLFAVMIRPEYVAFTKKYLAEKNSAVKVGTVIGFHEGTNTEMQKLAEAQKAIADGADELDFVINYERYKKEGVNAVKQEFACCTGVTLQSGKIAKWIIEIAALTDAQIAEITKQIADWTTEFFAGFEDKVFVKSSTGFYKTEGGKPNGATVEGIKIMLENAGKLPVKAAGGVKTPEEAQEMIALGVKRIGTSSAMALLGNGKTAGEY